MASKRKILEVLTRTGLLDIARHYEITGLTAQSKADIVDALAGSRTVQPEEFLTLFGRDDLKGICQSLGLDESGREKQVLMDRLMGRESETNEPQATANDTRQAMAKKKPKTAVDGLNVEDYRHSGAKRKNNPPAKIASEGTVPAMPKIEYSYSPRRPPVLRFDPTGKADQLPELLEKATKEPLTKEEAQILAEALRTQAPWLEWAGKKKNLSRKASLSILWPCISMSAYRLRQFSKLPPAKTWNVLSSATRSRSITRPFSSTSTKLTGPTD